MNRSSRFFALTLSIALVVIGGLFWNRSDAVRTSDAAAQEEEPELAEYMSSLHYYSQKLILAVANENEPLADFYLHEMEELAEEIEREVPEYEGHPIGELTRTMLVPPIEAVEEPLPGGDWERASAHLEELVQSCNSCHEATDHGFIQITAEPVEAFNQDFRARE